MPNFPSIYIELEELWKRLRGMQSRIEELLALLECIYRDENGLHIECTTFLKNITILDYIQSTIVGQTYQTVTFDALGNAGVALKATGEPEAGSSNKPNFYIKGADSTDAQNGGNAGATGGDVTNAQIAGGAFLIGGNNSNTSQNTLGGTSGVIGGTGVTGGIAYIYGRPGPAGGEVQIQAGSGTLGSGAAVRINSGRGLAGDGGDIVVSAANGTRYGGDVNIYSGNGLDGGGDIVLSTGTGSGGDPGGDIIISPNDDGRLFVQNLPGDSSPSYIMTITSGEQVKVSSIDDVIGGSSVAGRAVFSTGGTVNLRFFYHEFTPPSSAKFIKITCIGGGGQGGNGTAYNASSAGRPGGGGGGGGWSSHTYRTSDLAFPLKIYVGKGGGKDSNPYRNGISTWVYHLKNGQNSGLCWAGGGRSGSAGNPTNYDLVSGRGGAGQSYGAPGNSRLISDDFCITTKWPV